MPETQHGRFVNLKTTVDGNLRIILNTNGQRVFSMIADFRDRLGIDAAMRMLLDDYFKREWDEIKPEEIGALTSAVIITKEAIRDRAGKLLRVGRVYWNPAYQVEDEIATLGEKGATVFHGVE